MAEDKDGHFAVNWLDLLQGGKDKDGRFTETRFGLAEDVGGEDCLGEADLLDFGGVFKTFSWGLVTCLRNVK